MFKRLKNKIRRLINKEIIDVVWANSLAVHYNTSFQEYRGIYEGKDIYIVGCGPTAKFYMPKEDNESIYIGVNRAFKDDRFSFDYLFAQDQMEEGMADFLSYRNESCVKFIAIIPHEDCDFKVTDSSSLMKESVRYVLAGKRMGNIPSDISVEPVADLCGTVFSALQFALFTNPRRIFLVGFDCSTGNTMKNSKENYNYQLKGWNMIKSHLVSTKRNNTIVSINPVGLKDVFQDMYTREYLSLNGLDVHNSQVIT